MGAELQLPPGFRFHPTDEELVMHYLCRKCANQPIAVPIIAEIDLYKYHPWDLPDMALYGEKEWYFFSPRDRKYPNGSRPNRSAGCGYWKATGADKPIGNPKAIAIKKALVFYAGKAPKGDKTNWIMHEYRLANVDRSARNNNNSLRLDDWILCRIYNKKGTKEKRNVNNYQMNNNIIETEEKKPEILTSLQTSIPLMNSELELMYPDLSDSIPKLHTDSSSSEQVISPEFTSEVQSDRKLSEWDKNALGFSFNYNYDTTSMDGNGMVINHPFQNNYMSPLQDIFLDFQRPY